MIDPVYLNAPLYFSPPCSKEIQEHMRAGRLGMIATPSQGNIVEDNFLYCIDNGVFGGKYPGDDAYLKYLRTFQRIGDRCFFVVAPDVVGNHFRTWERSRRMLEKIRRMGFPVAFVAQNDMEYESRYLWDEFDYLFIGGDTLWKLGKEAAELARVAHDMGKGVHVGRVNSEARYIYAAEVIGAHSVDGTYLTYGPDVNLGNLLSWVRKVGTQETLF